MIDENHQIKFVSKVGTKLIHMFQRKDPFQSNCDSDECNPCVSSKENPPELSDCKVNNICYSAICKACEQEGTSSVYFGETSRNLHIRSREHIQLCKKKHDNSFMYKHIKAKHGNNVENVNFKFKVIGKFRKPIQRQLYESKCIEQTPNNASLNSKEEFNYQAIRKLKLKTHEKNQHCESCGKSFQSKNLLREHDDKFHRRYSCDMCDYASYGTSDLKEHKKTHT